MIFRAMLRADVPALAALDQICNPPGWSESQLSQEIDLPHSYHQVAFHFDKPIGFAVMWIVLEQAQLLEIAIHPKYRRQGKASLLLNEMISIAKQKGCHSMELELREDNLSAQKLYEKFGFSFEGERKNYYLNSGAAASSARLMRLKL